MQSYLSGTPDPGPEYRVHVQFHHSKIASFVKEYFFRKNPVIFFYWVCFFLSLCFVFFQARYVESTAEFLLYTCLGFPAFIFLIVPHELIHGIAYKLAGAKRVTYRAIWKKMIFYAIADGFLVKKTPFILLAISPFVLINFTLVWLCIQLDTPFSAVCSGALIMHIAGCSGDFALISYFFTHWKEDPLTLDVEASQETYFFLKVKDEGLRTE